MKTHKTVVPLCYICVMLLE